MNALAFGLRVGVPVFGTAMLLHASLYTRTLPSAQGYGSGEYDYLNIILVVVLALGITLLARRLSGRGGRKK